MNIYFGLALACFFIVSACGKSEVPKAASVADSSKEAPKVSTRTTSNSVLEDDEKFKETAIAGLKEQLKATLKDPDSVQFRNIDYFETRGVLPTGRTTPTRETICGQFNAKNALGGYVGFTDFISSFSISVSSQTKIVDGSVMIEVNDESKDGLAKKYYSATALILCKSRTINSPEEIHQISQELIQAKAAAVR